MANERTLLRDGVAALLEPLKTAGALRSVATCGYRDYEQALKAALATAPFALVVYESQQPGAGEGECEASVVVVVGATDWRGAAKRNDDALDLVSAVEDALSGKTVSQYGWRLQWGGDSLVAVDSERGIEVWELRWSTQIWKQTL